MNKLIFIPLLIFIFIITACHDNQQTPTKKSETPKNFDLAKITKQYADIALDVADISEQSYQNGAALSVTLSTPLNPETDIQSFFQVSDKNGQTIQGSWIISSHGLVAYFPEIEPSSTYTIDVYKGLTAATGKKLNQNISKKITTRRMPAQVSFISHGSVLPAKLAKGLAVISVNINEVDVDFHRIKPENISHFISTWTQYSGRSSQGNYILQQYSHYIDLVYSGRFPLNPPKNTRHTTHLDLNAIAEIKQSGLYLAVMKAAGSYEYEKQVTFFSVSDLGLHARMYPDRMTVQVNSLATGQALTGVSLTLVDNQENSLDQVLSDKQGQAIFISPSHKAKLLIAKTKNNITLLRLNSPALDLSEFAITGRAYKPIEIFTYGPRDLYRSGETVKINALLRDADGNNISALPLKAVIKRPDGQKIKFFTWYPDKQAKQQGFYHTEYTLPAHAPTGHWRLELETTHKNKHTYHFQVEDFLPERMELMLGNLSSAENWTNSTETLNIAVSGQYLYGAPAAKNRISTKVIIKANRHPLTSRKDYFFGLADEKPPIEYFELNDSKLDNQGLTTLKIPSRWKQVKNSPFAIKVITRLFETGGRTVTRSYDTHLWPQPTLIGIRPHLKLDNIAADSNVSFDLIKTNKRGELQGNTDVIATLIKERRDYYWEYSNAEGWHYEYTEKNFKTFEQRLNLTNQQATTVTVPVDWGYYLLIIKDSVTGQSSSLRFQAGNGWQQQGGGSARPDRVVLTLDKKSYRAGETAQLKIIPPYAGNGFVMLESSEKSLWFQRVSIPAEGLTLTIPIEHWKRHDLYFSTIIFRAGDAKEKITPNRAVGLIHLPLNRKNRQLSVNITTPEMEIRPEAPLSTTLTVSGATANTTTYLTLAAVDVGVLNITDFKTPDPYLWFFQPRRYAVEQHDMYHKIIELSDAGLTKPRFGGDLDKRTGGARPDSSVNIVSLFSEWVSTDENGVATIKLDIPDFNGRLRLMAIAFNKNQLGSAETEITVTAPIIAEASLPRFLAAGDRSMMTLELHNQSGQIQSLSLAVSATAPIRLTNKHVSLTLEDQQKTVLYFPIHAQQAFGTSQINLQLTNAETAIEAIQINRSWQLGVRPAYPANNYSQRKIISRGEQISIIPPLKDILINSAEADLNLSTQPPINIKQHLKSLLRYPYGCLEQTISSSYPWLSLSQKNLKIGALDQLKINNKYLNIDNKASQIEKGISALAGMQRNNGSFGLWSSKDPEEHWLTVYAADFFIDAREKGFNVPDELFNKTLIRLTHYVNHRGSMYGERYSQAPEHYTFAYKAYAAYVLSRVNQAPLGTLRHLYEHHRKQAKSALPLTHLGIALYTQGDQQRGLQAIRESINKPRNKNSYLSDYGSRLRDMSAMTYLLNKHPVPIKQSKTLIYSLIDELNNRHYLSTQEKNALFRLGIQLKKEQNQQWQGQLSLDNSVLKLQQNKTYNENFTGLDIPNTIQFSSNSTQPIYLQFAMNAYPKTAPTLHMDEIKIERNYYNLEGHLVNPEQFKIGDVLLVHLNIRAEQRIKDALVVELIPAGFELENQNLSNTIKTEHFKIGKQSIADMQYNHQIKYQEYLADRLIVAIDLHQHKTEHVFYLIQAVTTGQYTNPPAYVEDMYRPYLRAIGRKFKDINITVD